MSVMEREKAKARNKITNVVTQTGWIVKASSKTLINVKQCQLAPRSITALEKEPQSLKYSDVTVREVEEGFWVKMTFW